MYILAIQSVAGQMDSRFYYPSKEWAGIDSLDYREIMVPVDGDTLMTVLISPTQDVKATILYFHGNGGNISTYINGIKPLVRDGFQVFMTDFRSYGKSTGTPTHLNIAADAEIILATATALPEITGSKLIIYGASIGSQIATHLAKNHNDKIAALILDGTIASFTDIAVATSPKELSEVIRQNLVSPYSAKEDIKAIGGIPKLFIHSHEDKIPIAGAEEVFANAAEPKSFWVYTGGHLQAPVLQPAEFLKRVNMLLAE